jgi:hypothetical protein
VVELANSVLQSVTLCFGAFAHLIVSACFFVAVVLVAFFILVILVTLSLLIRFGRLKRRHIRIIPLVVNPAGGVV